MTNHVAMVGGFAECSIKTVFVLEHVSTDFTY